MATTTCSRDHEFCAVYKKEPPGNSSLHQYTRYCASECRRFNTTYTIGTYQKTKHCILCCDGDLCNNYLIDPCNPKSKVGRVEYGALIIVLITVIALYTWAPRVDSWLDGLAFPQFTVGKMLPTTFLSNRLIHDTRNLCTRLRIVEIKAMSCGFSGEQTSEEICQCRKSWSNLLIINNRKWRTFDSKDDSGKLWVEVIIVTSLNAVASKDFLPANNNDVNFVEIRRGVARVGGRGLGCPWPPSWWAVRPK